MPDAWLQQVIQWLAQSLGTDLFLVKGFLALLLVCTICGAVGALVVGNRMAFFSDAMAHCAFAGVALGSIGVLFTNGDKATTAWMVPLCMVAFGVLVGVGMVLVRDRTGLAHDTVIGVFFALALGVGALLTKLVQRFSSMNLETLLFGNLFLIPEVDLLYLCAVMLLMSGLFMWRYNQIMFASFNQSLARTRRMSVTVNNYLFIILLALVVNLSLKAVGAMLINAMLIVPAASAANVSRNLRQMFWLTILFCLSSGFLGFWLANSFSWPIGSENVSFSPSGMIVIVSVLLFPASVLFVAVYNRFAPIFGGQRFQSFHRHGPDDPCGADHPFGQCP